MEQLRARRLKRKEKEKKIEIRHMTRKSTKFSNTSEGSGEMKSECRKADDTAWRINSLWGLYADCEPLLTLSSTLPLSDWSHGAAEGAGTATRQRASQELAL